MDETTVARKTRDLAAFREHALRQFTGLLDNIIEASHEDKETVGKPPLSLEFAIVAHFEETERLISKTLKMHFKLPG